jgi:23S rRNA pseudouridine2457 synthase
MHHYFIIYKPFQVLSQFTSGNEKKNLKDLFKVPPDVYPVGRLDYDSEGLLILTNDKDLNYRLLKPDFKHEREYWIQVEGLINSLALEKLESGVDITVEGKKYHTRPSKAQILKENLIVPDRNPPIRFRKNIPVSWVKLIITEGKNRQVRKMTAQVGFPTLRLIRYRIADITVEGLLPGDMRVLDRSTIYRLLFD